MNLKFQLQKEKPFNQLRNTSLGFDNFAKKVFF